jgi:3'-phosphoadenosine 5'-phosphosulfate (PAPS) 3'-phosphatase
VWVDPLDGTNGFCSGDLDEVTILIGLSVDGKPRLGLIGVPYVKDSIDNLIFQPRIVLGDA